MDAHASKHEDLDAITEVTAALKRAGLHATKDQVVNLLPIHKRIQQRLKEIRQQLDPTTQPATTFSGDTKIWLERSKNAE